MGKARKRTREGSPSADQLPAGPHSSGDTTAAPADRERIAARAYELYLARGGEAGREMDDWLQAERELAPQANGRDREP